MLFSCSIADLISDFQCQVNSFAFVNLGFDLLISVLNSLILFRWLNFNSDIRERKLLALYDRI